MLTTLIATIALSSVAPVAPAISVSKVKTFSYIHATAIAVAPKGGTFAVASEDKQIRIIDDKTMQTKFQLAGHPMTPYAVAFSKDGRYLLSGDESARIWLWDARTGKKIREYPRAKGHTRGIQALAFSPNGQQFASVGKDDVIKIWNTAGGDPVDTIK
ncbi:MAG TPA: hypothetical protein VNI20_02220, partial [Fimbriimonadaceae bacterium]|nr:hypothetical protein [Fimbriimonadaceae bacterium]